MPHALNRARAAAVLALAAVALLLGPAAASTTLGGPMLGTAGRYDYSDQGVRDSAADTETHWWCGDTAAHPTDTILEQQYKVSTWTVTAPERTALQETPGAWDSLYTCNPSNAVRGSFPNVLGDGVTYTWAIYYVGSTSGSDNQIGAAFSLDGLTWHKYTQPVVPWTNTGHSWYGFGQPSVQDVGGALTMMYEESSPGAVHHEATSIDGVHWSDVGVLSTAGLPSPTPWWGSAAYDPQDGRWYAAYGDGWRPPATTGGVRENADGGFTLYATADPLAGTWTELDTVDTALTGYETNFLAGMLRDPDGTLSSAFLPSIKLLPSTAYPRPAYNASHAQLAAAGQFNSWDIAWHLWTPGSALRPLLRVHHGSQHDTTTGWYDSSYYTPEAFNLGGLYEAPTGDATVPLYLCKAFTTDYIPTTDPSCLGQYKSGLLGYLYASPGPGRIALYRCTVPEIGDMISLDPGCEHQQVHGLLGYSQG
jgi:hypothetical protein